MEKWDDNITWYGWDWYELRVTSYKLRAKNLKARVESLKARVEVQKCEFKSTSYEFKSPSCGFKPRVTSLNPPATSSNPRIIKSMNTQVSSLKSFPFLKVISPKLFGNLWGNSYVIVSCFTFPRLHSYGFSKKMSE